MQSKSTISRTFVFGCVLLTGTATAPASGADFSFRGTFQADDDRARFTFTIAAEARVAVRSVSYAGGTNAKGESISPGGFDTSVSIFDRDGLLVATNRDGGCGTVGQDATSLACWDASVNPTLPGGTYQVVLTQSENLPRGPFLSDGFAFDGTGNFTSSAGFQDYYGNRRSSGYAVDILGAESARPGQPEALISLVNGASNATGAIAPNTIVTYYGTGLGGGQPEATIAGKAAAVLYAGDTQINIAVPGDVPLGSGGQLRIQRGGTLIAALNVSIVAAAPALFTSNQSGSGPAAVLNQDYSVNAMSAPAARGSIIMVYGTGFGEANAPGGDGISPLKAGVTATIGGVPADVVFAGLAFGFTPGLQQINVRVPETAPVGGAVSIRLETNGAATQPGTTIAIQ